MTPKKLATKPQIISNSLTNSVIILVIESTKYTLEVNVVLQSDF